MSSPSRRKGGLGRGLASLIPTGPADPGDAATTGPRLGAAAADVVIGGPAAEAARAAQAQNDRDYAAWEARVRACQAGDRAACAPPPPR